jgi:hypothetical protein
MQIMIEKANAIEVVANANNVRQASVIEPTRMRE